jgi:hypothetical protein
MQIRPRLVTVIVPSWKGILELADSLGGRCSLSPIILKRDAPAPIVRELDVLSIRVRAAALHSELKSGRKLYAKRPTKGRFTDMSNACASLCCSTLQYCRTREAEDS